MDALSAFYKKMDELIAGKSAPWILEAQTPAGCEHLEAEAKSFVSGDHKSEFVTREMALIIGAAAIKSDASSKRHVLLWVEAPCPRANAEADGVTPRAEHEHAKAKSNALN